MLEEKLLKKIKTINENFINLGFDLEEDLIELVTQREDIKDRIENTKYKKMTFSKDEETNSYILNLEDCQISFDIIEGEDEELENYDLSLQDIKVEYYDENSVTYLVTANLKSEKIFYDYWGRDDDTKEIITSPANYKTYTGKINIFVTRNFEVIGKVLKTKSFNLEHIDTSELEIEINTWEEF